MTISKHQCHRYTRREALGFLGTAAGAGVVAASTGTLAVQAQQSFTSVDPPTFPAGARHPDAAGRPRPEGACDWRDPVP